jgi:hypothetical protein
MELSDANRVNNASGLQYIPENVYWEIVSELKHLQSVCIDFAWEEII